MNTQEHVTESATASPAKSRWFVVGYCTDEPQMLIDLVIAETREAAELWFYKFRPYANYCEAFDARWCDMLRDWLQAPDAKIAAEMRAFEVCSREVYEIDDEPSDPFDDLGSIDFDGQGNPL